MARPAPGVRAKLEALVNLWRIEVLAKVFPLKLKDGNCDAHTGSVSYHELVVSL